jgi:phage host-nuclease inhibitor protein Gam
METLQKLKAAHLREVNRLHEKIAGVQRKYTADTEALKQQIKRLQQKLAMKS